MTQCLNILVTGATRGIGHALTKAFTAKGHHVLGCGRSMSEVEKLRTDPGPRESFVQCDVSNDQSVMDWAQLVEAQGITPDIIINNAAVMSRKAPLWQTSTDELERVLRTNVIGMANMVRAFFPLLQESPRGLFINMSSGAGRMGLATIAPYCASKWAVEGLTKSLALELPEGMATVALSPGIVNTDMLRESFGHEATIYQSPDEWVEGAVDFILGLGMEHNGQSLTIPEARPPRNGRASS